MGFWKKLFNIGKAHANKAVESLEDPAVMLDEAIRQSEAQLRTNRQKVQTQLASVKRLESQVTNERNNVTVWEENAEKALRKGDENLAEQALTRSVEYQTSADKLQRALNEIQREYNKLKALVDAQQKNLEESKSKRRTILMTLQTAEIKKDLNETKAKIGDTDTSANDLLARMLDKADQKVAEADAAEELAESSGDSLEKAFENLDEPNTAIADKLAALKAKVNS